MAIQLKRKVSTEPLSAALDTHPPTTPIDRAPYDLPASTAAADAGQQIAEADQQPSERAPFSYPVPFGTIEHKRTHTAPAAPRTISPTPWTYAVASGIYDANGARIFGTCYARTAISSRVTYDEQEANARLATAAPGLLYATQHATDRLADLPRYLDANGHQTLAAVVAECLAALQHAAALAEGTD